MERKRKHSTEKVSQSALLIAHLFECSQTNLLLLSDYLNVNALHFLVNTVSSISSPLCLVIKNSNARGDEKSVM